MKTTLKCLKWVSQKGFLAWNRAAVAALILSAGSASATVVTTLGGGPNQTNPHNYGSTDGNTAQWSQFNTPESIALDPSGTLMFVADYTNNAIRQITFPGSASTSYTSTILRTNNGISRPVSVFVDANTNVFVLNRGNGTNGYILEFSALYAMFGNVTPSFVTTNAIHLTNATAMAVDGLTNFYVTVRSNMVIKIAQSGVVSTVGIITNANTFLRGIAVLDNGQLALTDSGNHGVWVMNPLNSSLSNNAVKLAGFHGTNDLLGPPAVNAFNRPEGISKAGNNTLVLADRGNNKVKLIDVASGTVSRLYGVNATNWVQGTAQNGIFPGWWDGTVNPNENIVGSVEAREPFGVFVAPDGSVFTTEVYYHIIRKVTATGLNGPGGLVVPALFNGPRGIALDVSGTFLYIADQTNNTVEVLDLIANTTSQYKNSGDGINRPSDVAVDVYGDVFVLNQGTGGNGNIVEFDSDANFVQINAAGLSSPTAMTLDFNGNIYVAELNGVIQQFSGGSSNTIVAITNAGVQLQGIAIFDDGVIAVSDSGNHVIWQVNPVTKAVSVLTGTIGVSGSTIGTAANAKLNRPQHLTKAAGNQLLLADGGNNRLAVVTRSGSVSTNLFKTTNSIVWFGRSGDPYPFGNSRWVSLISPSGVAIGLSGEVYDSELLNNNIRKITSTGLAQPPPPPPAPTPTIGWIDFQPPINPVSVLVTSINNSFILNNDVAIAILGPGDDQIFFTYGPTPQVSLIPDPNATNGATAPFYQNGMVPGTTPSSIIPPQPDVTIKAVGFNASSPYSAITQARFQFVVANPSVSGNNAALFSVTNVTFGTQFYYTLNGTTPDPVTNSANSIGPIANGAPISLNGGNDLTFKVRGFKGNYQPSTTITTIFASSNFIPNRITFGLTNANVELHSAFIARPGQFFYAPVTLQLQPGGDTMYSLQFNVSVTNASTLNSIPNGGGMGFFPMLQSQVTPDEGNHFPPNDGSWYLDILPFLAASATNAIGFSEFINTNNNLLGISWIYRQGIAYKITDSGNNVLTDFDTKKQDLITYSIAHDTLFKKGNGAVIVGAFSFQVPLSANIGDDYFMQLGSPSATRDGIGDPGSGVYIRSPGSNQKVEVGTPVYLVGDVAPFRWLNAGDFGEGMLDNPDVQQVYQSAILLIDVPPTNSDLYLAMDSCGGLGIFDTDNNYYTNAGPDGLSLPTVRDGGDKSIDQVAFGDGQLDVRDLFVTFRRSEDDTLLWFQRYWTNGQFVAVTTPNLAFNSNSPTSLSMNKLGLGGGGSDTDSGDFTKSFVSFGTGDLIASAGQTVQIPITANVFGDYHLRILGLNITVEPLDGSPAVINAIQFAPAPSGLGQPAYFGSKFPANYAGAWLNENISGLLGNSVIGTLTIKIPANATANSAYAIHFDHASASPNGYTALPLQTTSGLITLSSRTNSTWNDGIPDSWRLRYFGTINNALSQSTADADGDGMNNLHEYIAGTDPLNAKSNLKLGNYGAGATSSACTIHWPSVLGKTYVIERASSLYSPVWTMVSTNTGTGTDMEIDDSSGGNTRYYRVRVLP